MKYLRIIKINLNFNHIGIKDSKILFCDQSLVIKCPCPYKFPPGSFVGEGWGVKNSGKIAHVTYGWPLCQSSKVNIVAGRKSTSIRRFTVVDLGLFFWLENFTQFQRPMDNQRKLCIEVFLTVFIYVFVISSLS